MQLSQWLEAFAVRYPGTSQQNAWNVYVAANRMAFRPFLALWLKAMPGDRTGAFWLWTKARERNVAKQRQKRSQGLAKRRGYYRERQERLEVERQAQLDEAAAMAKAMRAKAIASGRDPDNERPIPVIRRNRRLTRYRG